MSAPVTRTDAHSNRYAPVAVEELDDWAWILGRLQCWLRHASPETVEDWAQFAGPGGIRLDHVTSILAEWTVRMRNLAEGRR